MMHVGCLLLMSSRRSEQAADATPAACEFAMAIARKNSLSDAKISQQEEK